MKPTLFLLLLLTLLNAKEFQQPLIIRCEYGSILTTKIILQALMTTGQKAKITKTSRTDQEIILELTTYSAKPFDVRYFTQILAEHGINPTSASLKDKPWKITLNASMVHWEIPTVSPQESGQTEKNVGATWFKLEESSALSIIAPYDGKWYPDVAVLDASMTVLASQRLFIPKEKLDFSLPDTAVYLKVSNTNGMKLLKNGITIEHIEQ